MASKNKSNAKPKMGPLGTPLGNPLGHFRSTASKQVAAYKKGGYNVPKNSLPKRNFGGDPPDGTNPGATPLSLGVPIGKNVIVGATSNLGKEGFNDTNVGVMYNNQKGVSGSLGYNLDNNQISGQGNVGKWSGNATYDINDKNLDANISRKIGNWDVGVGYSGDVSNPSLSNVNVNATGKLMGVPVKISAGGNQGLKFGAQKKGGSLKPKASKGMIVKSKRK